MVILPILGSPSRRVLFCWGLVLKRIWSIGVPGPTRTRYEHKDSPVFSHAQLWKLSPLSMIPLSSVDALTDLGSTADAP